MLPAQPPRVETHVFLVGGHWPPPYLSCSYEQS